MILRWLTTRYLTFVSLAVVGTERGSLDLLDHEYNHPYDITVCKPGVKCFQEKGREAVSNGSQAKTKSKTNKPRR